MFRLLFLISSIYAYPIVLLHGIESNAMNLEDMKVWIETNFNRKVYNIELGTGDKYSTKTPLYMQVDELMKTIHGIPELASGFDFIGISQGGLIGRGYVQKYNTYSNFMVRTMITLVTPHGGVYLKNLKLINFYSDNMQQTQSFSNYWRDPINYNTYLMKSTFLADANMEKPDKNPYYMENIITLMNFVMVYSPFDEIIKPPESGIFSTYNDKLEVITLQSTDLYKYDWLGLKTLNSTNRLYTFQTNCTHSDHRNPICFPQLYPIFQQFL